MKSKKKLIYKLHQNFNQNPYKKVEQISFRNAGAKAYDFNKLRSIRAISLKGQSTQNLHSGYVEERNSYNITKFAHYEDRDQIIYQRLIDAGFGNNKTERKCGEFIAQQNPTNKGEDYRSSLLPEMSLKRSLSKHYNQDHQDSKDPQIGNKKSQIRPKNSIKHQRNVSLPAINMLHQSDSGSKNVNVTVRKEFVSSYVEEQKAKQHVMKQLGVKHSLSKIVSSNQNLSITQQKINNQVLASIKLKSVETLERIARSRSQAVMVDKWKEKYGQSPKTKNKKVIEMMNQKLAEKLTTTIAEKYSLPRIQETEKYLPTMKDEERELIKQEKEHAEEMSNRYEKYGNSQQLYREKQSNLQTNLQYQSVQIAPTQLFSQKKHIFCLNHYLSKQNPTISVEKQKQSAQLKQEFFSSQPLNITVTKMKKHQRKNKQNLNLQSINSKDKINLNFNQIPEKNYENMTGSQSLQENSDRIMQNQRKSSNLFKRQKIDSESLSADNSSEKIKKFLSFKEPKGRHQKKQILLSNDAQNFNKQKTIQKCKINQQKALMQKMMESEAMIEWENKRSTDIEQLEFHAFVKCRVNEISQ